MSDAGRQWCLQTLSDDEACDPVPGKRALCTLSDDDVEPRGKGQEQTTFQRERCSQSATLFNNKSS